MTDFKPAKQSLEALAEYHSYFTDLRRRLHTIPETSYTEEQTSAIIAAELESYGIEVHRGIAKTGVLGVIRNGNSDRCIALRADIDALPIYEQNDLPYRSTIDGKMHACGHDGHTTMLLYAARHLSATRAINGTLVFIFQPAEEGGAGARRMIEEGLWERFPIQEVYGMHNIPGIKAGDFAVKPGPMMAAGDLFTVTIRAKGAHAALPHTTGDPILAGSAFVQSAQSIVSRGIDPLDSAVVSITRFNGGEATNVIPTLVTIQGTARTYTKTAQATIADGLKRIGASIAQAYNVECEVEYDYGYPATINSEREALFSRDVLVEAFGSERVHTNLPPMMGAEDFSFMLQERPGAYLWIGNGDSSGLHTPTYNFNDDILPYGAAAWVSLAESALKA
jgi:amidohydrolase